MNTPRQPSPAVDKQAGEDGVWRPGLGYLLLALGLVVAGLAYWIWSPSSPEESAEAASAAAPHTALPSAAPVTSPVASWPPPLATRAAPQPDPEGDADPTRDLSSYAMRGEKATMPEVIERLHKAGIYSGLGAFSPPGTRPAMVGLAVPEDFVLPEGYVRHHQATDDGQRIEAILMFAPDRQFFDANNQPINIPANRVVPPEYAPPGLPLRRIVLPKPIETAGQP